MLTVAKDFEKECDTLAAALCDADEATFSTVTLFKDWTIDDVVGHLHMWNHAAAITLESREKFHEFFAFVATRMTAGDSHPMMQRAWLNENAEGVKGKALFNAWRDFYPKLANSYYDADDDTRVAWAGPDMSAGAKIIARQMETWAHGQEVFDVLGKDREEGDRIKNICDLGVRTYSWTFRNRSEEPPKPKPFVKLKAPSGADWEWNDPQNDNVVSGDATEFARVVTQTRNVADTSLTVNGGNAIRWMSIAQCFAGAPETPPAKGERRKAS